MTGPRVCLVHERFTEYAGSERVVEQLAAAWPRAAVLAPVNRPDGLPPGLASRLGRGSLDRYVRPGGGYAHLLPVLPAAVRRLPVPGDAEVVVASHHAFATQVVHATSAPVVAYVHTPARWVYDPEMRAGEAGGWGGAAALSVFGLAFRGADRRAARRLRSIVANSREVADRVGRWWDRESAVVHPPVDTGFYTPDPSVPREDFFLMAGRLVPYKQPALAVAAARQAGVRLVVAGDGRARAACESLAGPGITFLGRVDAWTQRDLYRRCAALLMPGVEDFGIVPVEAQACGAPVLAVDAGGALDSVLPGRTGEHVPSAHLTGAAAVQVWARALTDVDPARYDAQQVRRHAESFSEDAFRTAMGSVVTAALR